ncbi:MAG: hypothetical protein AAF988_06765 [Pseudomonadota bacterium]
MNGHDVVADGGIVKPEGLDVAKDIGKASTADGNFSSAMGGTGFSGAYVPGECPNPEKFAEGFGTFAKKMGPIIP